MTLEGKVVNGQIVLTPREPLPEGRRVKIEVEEPESTGNSLRDRLLQFAGSCPGLPADMAEQHDHYIHGTPKR
jgi:hypothetical protein